MNIQIELFSKKDKGYAVLIGIVRAIKDGTVIKENKIKEIKEESKIFEFSKDVYNSFTSISPKFSFEIFSNIEELDNLDLQEKFNVDEVKELDIAVFESVYTDDINEMISFLENDMNLDVPSFVNNVEMKDEYKKSILLFMIANYFSNNESKIFDFPMFLKMREAGLVDKDMMVEEFVESLLEKAAEVI